MSNVEFPPRIPPGLERRILAKMGFKRSRKRDHRDAQIANMKRELEKAGRPVPQKLEELEASYCQLLYDTNPEWEALVDTARANDKKNK